MSFRTFGWFGPLCPQAGNFDLDGLEMYDYATNTPLSGFPLEIASKIFWEADEITLNASCTARSVGTPSVTTTFSGSISVKWGGVVSGLNGNTIVRPPLSTAREMLCIVSNPTSGDGANASNSFRSTQFDVSPRGSLQIRKRPILRNNKLYAPFLINFEGAITTAVGAQIFITTPISSVSSRAIIVGNAQWITPWGNVSTPYRFLDFLLPATHISSFMTITVTAADPATRYA